MSRLKILALSFLTAAVLTGALFGGGYFIRKHTEEVQAASLFDWPEIDFYFFYKRYMSWVDDGVSGKNNIALPTTMRTQLQPFYKYELKDVRVAYTTRFSNLGMTDCKKIYFGNKDIVSKVQDNKTLTKNEVRWLAHEITHGEQCDRWGSRKNYANNWFKQVSKEVLREILKGNWKDIVKNIDDASKLSKVDDKMSMEQEAQTRAEKVVKGWKF